MREICMSGSMSEVWKRSHGRASEAPPNERGGNRYARPTATAPHLDSTKGVLNIAGEEGPVVVHGVQHIFHPPVSLPHWPYDDRRSRLVLIARDLDRQLVAETWQLVAQPAAGER
jgi:G3E family GTPase